MRVVAPRRFDLDEPVAVHADAHFAIAVHTPERQVVQQLVGDDDMRRSAQGRAGAHAVDRGQRRTRAGAHVDGLVVYVASCERAEHLRRERAVARADLGDPDRLRFAEGGEQLGHNGAQHRSEHRVDVRAGDEVAGCPDRRIFVEATRTVERAFHELGERDGAVVADRAADRLRHLLAHGEEYAAVHAWENPGVVDELRLAASVVAGRDGAGGLELLVIERSRSSRFLPGYVAFPGGATDPGDAVLAAEWFGTEDEISRACAIRELSEETALVVTVDGMGPIGSWDPLSPVGMAPPSPDQLPEIAHWIAPEEVPVRFDARYYAAEGFDGLEPTPDGSEAASAWWTTAQELLAGHDAGTRKLYWPTYFTLTHLATCSSVADLLALRFETREPTNEDVERMPRSTFWQD